MSHIDEKGMVAVHSRQMWQVSDDSVSHCNLEFVLNPKPDMEKFYLRGMVSCLHFFHRNLDRDSKISKFYWSTVKIPPLLFRQCGAVCISNITVHNNTNLANTLYLFTGCIHTHKYTVSIWMIAFWLIRPTTTFCNN